ncbi:HD domain-containing protein [Geomonas sp. Red69]|uniref:HD-GYP domain-containing protein n=1 Tax=Geomonas diazotrophica TaxID=2843197 RepID=UPI001C0F653E|nr:HD domain-containing phosphohydrolase [Geomonas diazotrophica]MBU5638398.1 HD domain-containing protein [Geomonas diazotrophica]
MNDANLAARNIIRLLQSASANAALYESGHLQVVRLGNQLFEELSAALEACGELSVIVVENELIVNGRPQEHSLFFNRFATMLKARGIEHLKFLRGITREEVKSLVYLLSAAVGQGEEIASSDHLRFGCLKLPMGGDPSGSERGDQAAAEVLKELSQQELDRFTEMYRTVQRRQQLKISGIAEVVTGFVELFRQEGMPLLVLAALRDSDEYTFTHSANVCILNLAQAMALGIEGPQLRDIGVAAMLHDIGKLFVPEEVLNKKGKLTNEEFELIKQHPVRGARYLMDVPGVPRMAAIAAYEHHAKFNLSGYPEFSASWRLNLCSHLTMVSDFFDATRTRRSYREPLELDQITTMMLDMSGTELHPALTRNFFQIIADLKSPVGGRLSS